MKVIEHSVFEEPGAGSPIGLLFFPSLLADRRERNRERVRQRVEAFIKEIGVERVVSINEEASLLDPFAVTVWWYRELPDTEKREKPETETLVIRPSEESKTPYDYQWGPE